MKKFWKKLLGKIFGWFRKPVVERVGGWFKGKVDRESRKVTFPKVVWNTGMPSEPGTYIVKHKRRTRRVIWKMGWVADFRDRVFMKGVYAWRPAPENLIKIW